jgi:hypothetical protein
MTVYDFGQNDVASPLGWAILTTAGLIIGVILAKILEWMGLTNKNREALK